MAKVNTETKHARPVQEVRIDLIKAAIWANQGDDGVRHNVTFERSYKDGEEWKTTTSFGRDDLLTLAKVADLAHTWIVQERQERSAEREPESASRRSGNRIEGRLPKTPATPQ
jgi:hypothetical protein